MLASLAPAAAGLVLTEALMMLLVALALPVILAAMPHAALLAAIILPVSIPVLCHVSNPPLNGGYRTQRSNPMAPREVPPPGGGGRQGCAQRSSTVSLSLSMPSTSSASFS